jgi:AraC family transcriptional regulator of adaptative response/methylated-DNA-[protein]-cysteine methyltransferase
MKRSDMLNTKQKSIQIKNKALPTLSLKMSYLETPLGQMVAMADSNGLYLLEFMDRRSLAREVAALEKKSRAAIVQGENAILKQIKRELKNYFAGKDFVFTTPIHLVGSPFQLQVWKALMKIPLGETRAYADIAKAIKNPLAVRAVGRANGINQLSIIIPCHRVINANGSLGGYGGGLTRKEWLLAHESNFVI